MIEQTWPKLRVLHYLYSESHGRVVAHCLDLDIVATANKQAEALRRLNTLVKAHVELSLNKGNYAGLMTPAPPAYWTRFMNGAHTGTEVLTLEVRVPQVVPTPEPQSVLGIIATHAAEQRLAHAAQ